MVVQLIQLSYIEDVVHQKGCKEAPFISWSDSLKPVLDCHRLLSALLRFSISSRRQRHSRRNFIFSSASPNAPPGVVRRRRRRNVARDYLRGRAKFLSSPPPSAPGIVRRHRRNVARDYLRGRAKFLSSPPPSAPGIVRRHRHHRTVAGQDIRASLRNNLPSWSHRERRRKPKRRCGCFRFRFASFGIPSSFLFLSLNKYWIAWMAMRNLTSVHVFIRNCSRARTRIYTKPA